MDPNQAQSRFHAADVFYRDKRYAEALAVLDELDAAYPDTQNIMLPRARCMRHLNRIADAVELCDRLIEEFGDVHAAKLKHLMLNREPDEPHRESSLGVLDGLPVNPALDLGLDAATPPPVPHARKPAANWSTPVLIAVGVLAGLAVITALSFVFLPGTPSTAETDPAAIERPAAADVPAMTITDQGEIAVFGWSVSPFGWWIIGFIMTIGIYMIALYFTLKVSDKLPHDDLAEDLKNVGLISVVGALLSNLLPCLGLIPGIIMLRRTYELSLIEFFILLGFNITAALFVFGIFFFSFMMLGLMAAPA